MSAENEALVRRLFEEVWNQGNMSAAKEIVHEDYTSPDGPFWITTPESSGGWPGRYSEAGLETLEQEMESYRETYSDLRFEIERTFSENRANLLRKERGHNDLASDWHRKGRVFYQSSRPRAARGARFQGDELEPDRRRQDHRKPALLASPVEIG